jgi:6-hydroxynicotinate 3-monooxygenase
MAGARRIAVVGAGLGGLAAAIALRRQGFEVQICEQAPELAEFGAGINISPNSVKVFHALELADKLRAISSEPVGLTWRDWGSDTIHNRLPFVDFEKRYGAKYYVVHRSDRIACSRRRCRRGSSISASAARRPRRGMVPPR